MSKTKKYFPEWSEGVFGMFDPNSEMAITYEEGQWRAYISPDDFVVVESEQEAIDTIIGFITNK